MSSTSKSLGYVLGRMYPGSFASYRGVVFRVTGQVSGSTLRGVEVDFSESMKLNGRLTDQAGQELKRKVAEKISKEIRADSGRSFTLTPSNLNILVPSKVNLRFDEALDVVFCSDRTCGTLDKLEWRRTVSKTGMPRCRKCHKSPVQQAPIFIPVRRSPSVKPQVLMGSTTGGGVFRTIEKPQLFCPNSTRSGTCKVTKKKCPADFIGKLASLEMTDPHRPIDSLMIVKRDCPIGLRVEPQRIRRPWRTTSYFYVTDFPRESMTSPLSVSAVEPFSVPGDNEVQEVNEALHDVKPVKFSNEIADIDRSVFSRLKVLEVIYGFKIGGRLTGISNYYLSGRQNETLGRLIETQGFVLTFKPILFERLESIRKEKFPEQSLGEITEIALHSIEHAMLVLAPQYTGFEPGKFHGSYSYDLRQNEAAVYVYDSDEGGSGGFASLMCDRERFVEMVEQINTRLDCPQRECNYACKLCLYVENCGQVNRKLNRKLVKELGLFLG